MRNIKIKFPLYINDGQALDSVIFSDDQINAINQVKTKIKNKIYKFQKLSCICGNNNTKHLITEKDRYGFNFPNVICPNCGVIRPIRFFNDDSLKSFYAEEYRKIYVWNDKSLDKQIATLFQLQKERGKRFLEMLTELNFPMTEINKILEIGCGCGGVLKPFKDLKKNVLGCDFETQYIKYGISKGLDVRKGDIETLGLKEESQDLVILSHVLEHFKNPIKEMNKIVSTIAFNKYLLVEVPSTTSMDQNYENPLQYFQNAHVYNFSQKNLRFFFDELGLETIYADAKSTFLLRKKSNWKPYEKKFVMFKGLKKESTIVENLFKKTYLHYETSKGIIKENLNLVNENHEIKRKMRLLNKKYEKLLKEKKL